MSQAGASIPHFYLAVTAAGSRKFGMRYAEDESALSAALTRDQLLLLRSWRLPKWTAKSPEVSLKDQAELNEQLSLLLDRGVPLIEALEVAQSVVSNDAKPRVEKMRELVSSGQSFADAAANVGGFDEVTITVYRSAERSGDLAPAARRLAEAARRRLNLVGKVGTMMIYPAVVLVVAALVTIVVLTVVVPRVTQTLNDMGAELPWYTQITMAAGEGLRNNWEIVSLVAAMLVAFGLMARRVVARAVIAGLRKVPLFGSVMLASESARFFAVMGAMTRSGVPLADALAVATGVISHPKLRAQLDDLAHQLVEGGVLRTLLERVDALPLATRRLLIAADRAGDLDQAFDGLATDMAAEVDKQSSRALSLLEPLLIVALFLVVGALLMSVMFPLITLGARTQNL